MNWYLSENKLKKLTHTITHLYTLTNSNAGHTNFETSLQQLTVQIRFMTLLSNCNKKSFAQEKKLRQSASADLQNITKQNTHRAGFLAQSNLRVLGDTAVFSQELEGTETKT